MILQENAVASTPGPTAGRAVPRIEAIGVRKYFHANGQWICALEQADVEAADGEFVSIIGPSGCGKSTLFNIFAGLERVTAGQVLIDGKDVTGKLGLVGYMPQKDLLLPWKSILDNTIIGLRLLGVSRREARRQALELFPRFGLSGFEHSYPATLSGGMRQRAAFLRTVLSRREILLLDEPFGALDSLTRTDMQQWLLEIWDSLRKTIIFVTHDVDEAIFLSDRVYVMRPRPGRIEAVVPVTLPRPRDYSVVTTAQFAELKHRLLSHLKRAPSAEEGS